jgi:hypothetical protein
MLGLLAGASRAQETPPAAAAQQEETPEANADPGQEAQEGEAPGPDDTGTSPDTTAGED